MNKEKADKISPRGSDAVAFLSEICTPAEIEVADMKARLVPFGSRSRPAGEFSAHDEPETA